MINKIKETESKRERAQVNQIDKLNVQSSFINKLKQRFPTKLGATVFALIVLHFVSQFVFFQSEKEEPKIENESKVEVETKYEARMPDFVKLPDTPAPDLAAAPPSVQPEPRMITPTSLKYATPTVKKKEPRESKAERIRRAEKILTGV